ncbi:hypothetical protein BJX70DRAFT_357051 [Aspergillus crustosus]
MAYLCAIPLTSRWPMPCFIAVSAHGHTGLALAIFSLNSSGYHQAVLVLIELAVASQRPQSNHTQLGERQS